jgi:2-desacetyl-2-hydroxyethyl bacteriochlorophyllide A dehydrogenase
MNRNIIFTGVNTAELVDKPMPSVGPKEVRVKLVRSTLSSGTERANVTGSNVVSIWDGPDAPVVWPRQSGYSSSGVVDAVGEGVLSVKVGDRVALSWTLHSEYIVVPENRVYKLPENVSFEAGALTHIATFSMAAIRKCKLELGESAIVMGQGILGQLAVMLLKCAGAAPVIAADPIAERRERALQLGADIALDPTASDFCKKVLSACSLEDKGIYTGERACGVKVAIEVTGVGAGLNGVLDVMAPMGRVALLGCTRDSDFSVDYYHKVHGRGVSLIGAHTWARPSDDTSSGLFTHRDDAKAFLNLLSLGRFSVDGFVSSVCSPADCAEVYSRLAEGGSFPNTQFDWTAL